jgi:large subunit ribosomal protein L10
MIRNEKIEAVAAIEEVYRNNSAVIVAHYHGLTVSQVSKLRKVLGAEGAKLKVVKNTLAKIAAKNAGIADVETLFKGPVAIAYSADPVSAAKVVAQFAKENDALKIVGGILDSKVIDDKVVRQLSSLPSINELRGKIIGILQAPATKLACITAAPASQVARVISAYSNKK